MSLPKETKAWILNEPPTDRITSSTFKVETRPLPSADELKEGEVLVQIIALSNDPAQRTWMDPTYDPKRMYTKPINQGEVVRAGTLSKILASKSQKWKEGQVVSAYVGWTEYAVVNEAAIQTEAVRAEGLSEFISLSSLGSIGMTAYMGVFEECKLKPEHTVVVSGAAGAVGSLFVQIAKKVVGCKKVIGIAGGKAKCDWVKSLGADECIDYKDKAYAELLVKALPDYADVYFDNVGGDILDNMLKLTKRYGYIAACGAISQYNEKGLTLKNWGEVIFNRLTVKGLLVLDYVHLFPKASSDLRQWIQEGKIDVTEGEMVVDTKFEDIPKTWGMLFDGGNKGKLITKLV